MWGSPEKRGKKTARHIDVTPEELEEMVMHNSAKLTRLNQQRQLLKDDFKLLMKRFIYCWRIMERTRVLSHYVCEKDVEDGTMLHKTLPGVWAIQCHVFMADEITLTTVNGKQWVVGVLRKKDGKIILSGEAVNQFNAHYNLVVSNEVEFQTGFGRNFFVRIRKYNGVEIDYESEGRKPNDKKNKVPPTLSIMLGEEDLNAGILGEQYTTFAGSTEVQVVVADGMTWNLMTRKKTDNTVTLTGNELKYFINHYMIRTSFRLMFEYMDDDMFRVVVMDNLGVEIDYPKIISVGMALNDNI
ncbi:hypothetical protein ACFE04_002927 [Oxalis oulophora]